MKRDAQVTHDLDRETRNSRTQQALAEAGIHDVHVLTVGTYEPTLVIFESGRDAYKGSQTLRDLGWYVSRVSDDFNTPPAFWVRHPSPFAPAQRMSKGRTFLPNSSCPTDVEYALHMNGIVFKRIDCGVYSPEWRAMPEHGGDGGTYSWSSLNSDGGDGSTMVEVFLVKESDLGIEDLRNPIWRAVEAVVTQKRLSEVDTPYKVVDLVHDAVVAAFNRVIVDRFVSIKE